MTETVTVPVDEHCKSTAAKLLKVPNSYGFTAVIAPRVVPSLVHRWGLFEMLVAAGPHLAFCMAFGTFISIRLFDLSW